jgi:hypothetical protein
MSRHQHFYLEALPLMQYIVEKIRIDRIRIELKQADPHNESIKNIYNLDVCQIDFDLYKNEEWAGKIFSLLAESKEYSIEPWLTGKEISQYRKKTINWLSYAINEPRITPKYITEDVVREFIKATTQELRFLINEWK